MILTMSTESNYIGKQVKTFCAQIGADPLLVQGAGGNVSWKDGGVLWVKASGTWLADAESKEIFVPVNLPQIQDALAKSDFSIKPEVLNNSGLRPSIETILHALMPHKIIVHLHSIEILANLVRKNFRQNLENAVGNKIKFQCIEYFKPGPELANAIHEVLKENQSTDVIFMKNHGVVLGGENIKQICNMLFELNSRLSLKINYELVTSLSSSLPENLSEKYRSLIDSNIPLLAVEPSLYSRLARDWCIYPDHIVFLGERPNLFSSWKEAQDFFYSCKKYPDIIFIENEGVFVTSSFTKSQEAQIKCYLDVLLRQESNDELNSLTDDQISELMMWDAEKYRISLSS